MKKFLFYILALLLSNPFFAQLNQTPELISNEFYIENSKIFSNEKNWIIVDQVCSDINLKEKVYILNNESEYSEILSEYSNDESLPFQYYFCDVFEFKKGEGLKLMKRIILKDLNYFDDWVENPLNKMSKKNKLTFNCNNDDLNKENIHYISRVNTKSFVIEATKEFFFVSIFNQKCQMYERIKVKKEKFRFFETTEYFMFRGERLLLLFAEGA